MQNIIPLILAVFFVYLLFSRKGGMGCCGSHGDRSTEPDKGRHFQEPSANGKEQVIDLGKDQYYVLPVEADRRPQEADRTGSRKRS